MPHHPSAAAAHIVEWMIAGALASDEVAVSFEGLVRRLRDEGIAIDRAFMGHPTLHPLHTGAAFIWTREGGLARDTFDNDDDSENDDWIRSPVRHVIVNDVERMRRRLAGAARMLDFPMLETLSDEGMTDYLLLASRFDSFSRGRDPTAPIIAGAPRSGVVCSFATARPDGFTDQEIETLHWLLKPLAIVVKMADQRQVARNLAECYIGKEAGPRVLDGAIRRGDFASTPAVIWLSDLRASTRLSMELPREEFIATINAFFDCTAGAVEEEGGEPLSFIGDGALAIFPIERMGEDGARRAAIRAAERATAALDALNETRAVEGREALGWGIALHSGVIEYGNIGSLTRHSWSVVGAAVNETARLEGATKRVKGTTVASRAFVDGLGGDAAGWRSEGLFSLEGVPGKFEVFTPPGSLAEAAAASRQEEPA